MWSRVANCRTQVSDPQMQSISEARVELEPLHDDEVTERRHVD
jgi:hypothetical protein